MCSDESNPGGLAKGVARGLVRLTGTWLGMCSIEENCMKRINAGTAPHQYHPVGIVKKASCPGKLADMKGKRSCLSRYGRSVGWTVPIATMIDANLISTVLR